MEIDAEVRRQTIISLVAVGLFIASLVTIGIVYDGSDGLPEAGALALVAALAGFILLMAGVGVVLERLNNDRDRRLLIDEFVGVRAYDDFLSRQSVSSSPTASTCWR